jgi:DNA/RNA-binding domain of Phe-tRNA-synthetase-like protein
VATLRSRRTVVQCGLAGLMAVLGILALRYLAARGAPPVDLSAREAVDLACCHGWSVAGAPSYILPLRKGKGEGVSGVSRYETSAHCLTVAMGGEMSALVFTVTPAWRAAYPEALVGTLALSNDDNPPQNEALDRRKTAVETALRSRFAGLTRAELRAMPTLQAYEAYYRGFQKTYHVQLQLESVALKGKSIPRVAALVEAMFVAELQNQLLTAGHDLAALDPPIRLDVARGTESYTLINGQEQQLKPGDMYIADRQSVMSSVLYGPDQRTRIAESTRDAIFTVYVPPGIDRAALDQHLDDIIANVRLISPSARVELREIVGG